jgi:hypothetical protein
MMECRNIDELMMEFLYQELDASQTEAFRTHVGGCARCSGELASLQATRRAVRALPELEPSADVSTRLLAAARRAPAVEVKGVTPVAAGEKQGLLAWIASLFRPMTMHPAFAAVAALVLIGGVAGFLALKGNIGTYKVKPREQTSQTATQTQAENDKQAQAEREIAKADGEERGALAQPTMPAQPMKSPEPALEAAHGEKDQKTAGDNIGDDVVRNAPVGRVATPEEQQRAVQATSPQHHAAAPKADVEAPDDVKNETKPTTNGESYREQELDSGGGGGAGADKGVAEKRPEVVTPKDKPSTDPNVQAPAKQNQHTTQTEKKVMTVTQGDEDSEGPTADEPAQAPPQAPQNNAGVAKEAPPKSKTKKDVAAQLHGQARAKAATGDCRAVGTIKQKIYKANPDYYNTKVRNDPDLARCDESRAKKVRGQQPAPQAPEPARDRSVDTNNSN